jgi:hypothetical protein
MLPNLVPATVSIVPEKIYDKLWVSEIVISSPDLNGDAVARVFLRKFGVFDGEAQFMPGDEGIRLTIDNLLSKSEQDSDLANIVQSLLLYIGKAGAEQGVIAPINSPE